MADKTDVLTEQGPDKLAQKIEQARESLAQTVDTIAERVSPASAARRAVGQARERAGRPGTRLIGAGAMLAAAAAVFLVWRRRRG